MFQLQLAVLSSLRLVLLPHPQVPVPRPAGLALIYSAVPSRTRTDRRPLGWTEAVVMFEVYDAVLALPSQKNPRSPCFLAAVPTSSSASRSCLSVSGLQGPSPNELWSLAESGLACVSPRKGNGKRHSFLCLSVYLIPKELFLRLLLPIPRIW